MSSFVLMWCWLAPTCHASPSWAIKTSPVSPKLFRLLDTAATLNGLNSGSFIAVACLLRASVAHHWREGHSAVASPDATSSNEKTWPDYAWSFHTMLFAGRQRNRERAAGLLPDNSI